MLVLKAMADVFGDPKIKKPAIWVQHGSIIVSGARIPEMDRWSNTTKNGSYANHPKSWHITQWYLVDVPSCSHVPFSLLDVEVNFMIYLIQPLASRCSKHHLVASGAAKWHAGSLERRPVGNCNFKYPFLDTCWIQRISVCIGWDMDVSINNIYIYI